jgi:hypothetical protein
MSQVQARLLKPPSGSIILRSARPRTTSCTRFCCRAGSLLSGDSERVNANIMQLSRPSFDRSKWVVRRYGERGNHGKSS